MDPARAVDAELPNLARDVVEAYRNAPGDRVVEVIDGQLYSMPRPRPQHQSAGGELYSELAPPFRRGRGGPGGWIILPEPELRLGALPDLVEPDLAGWRRERLPDPPEGAAITAVPDQVCEVLSSSTRRHDRIVKMPMYHRHGVAHVWHVDPEAQTLDVYRRVDDGWLLVVTAGGDASVRAEPFDAIEMDLRALWAW